MHGHIFNVGNIQIELPRSDQPMDLGWPACPPFNYQAALPVSLDEPLDVPAWTIWTNNKNGQEYIVYEVLPDKTDDGKSRISYMSLVDNGRYNRDKENFSLKFTFARRLLVDILYLPIETVKSLESLYPMHVFRVSSIY
jgi:hypothetical protein